MPEPYNIETAACPSCGEPMQLGYIAGQWLPLRWTENRNPKTVFAGDALHQKGALSTATLRAARCTRCGVGVFTFPQ
jgi:ribosomal protein S27AE